MESYFNVPKNVALNFTRHLILKIPNKRELQQIAFNHLSNIDSQKINSKSIFLVIDTTLASHNPLHFRKNLLERT